MLRVFIPSIRPIRSSGQNSSNPAATITPLERTFTLPAGPPRLGITGPEERNLKVIREAFGVRLAARGEHLRITGDDAAVARAARVVERLAEATRHGRPLSHQAVLDTIAELASDPEPSPHVPNLSTHHEEDRGSMRAGGGGMDVYLGSKRVRPMTDGQRAYLDAIQQHDLTLCIGPAGTGKTYVATAAAVNMLKRGEVRKLVLVRPAVEAGEKLGFLPGSMQDKVNPYLRPLLDALHDMMEFEQITRFMAADLIEIVPLAFMRGRTLNDACIILDEAQNTTRAQMLMFLTRLGHGSKMVVTGDTSQIDLEDPRESGLIDAARRLRHTPGVAMVTLTGSDIVRHTLVQRIVEAYGEHPRRQPPTLFLDDEDEENASTGSQDAED